MARSRETVDGSLELLLDTITNTFGSVLFITMLVAVLLRMAGRTSSEPPAASKTDQARIAARITELSSEIDRLSATLDALPPADPTLARIESKIVDAGRETAKVLAADADVAKEIATHQERITVLDRQATEAARDLDRITPLAAEQAARRKKAEELAADLAKRAIELDRPVDPDRIVQTARLPQLAATQKKQIGLYMKYGRVYVMHEWGPTGERLGPNANHFVISRMPDGRQKAKARPDAGHIADGTTIKQTLRDILRRFSADGWVVFVTVNEDSFAQFQSVKAALVDLGYEYEPIVIHQGPTGGIWDSGGTSVRGQ